MPLASEAGARDRTLAQRLGYPADAKLLIIHADDLAVAHSVDMASFEALNQGPVSSASVMVPCPWLTEVADYAKSRPDVDLGVHITLTSEWKTYRWGPIASREQVPSLLDPQGYLRSDKGEAVRHITREEAEWEVRAQVETALKMGIHPTHLDAHVCVLYGKPPLLTVLANVAHDCHLPFLMTKIPGAPPDMYAALSPSDVILERVFMATPPIDPDEWSSYYTAIPRTVLPGVSELLVHLAYDDAEMQAITVDHPNYGSA
jgi:hypothetical protein